DAERTAFGIGEKLGLNERAAVKRYVLGPGAAHGRPEFLQRLKHLFGHGAMRGELAAIEADEASSPVGDRGQLGATADAARPGTRIIVQRTDAGPGEDDICGRRGARAG